LSMSVGSSAPSDNENPGPAHHHHHDALVVAEDDHDDVPFMEPHAADHHDHESNDVHIPTPSPQPLHDDEPELPPVPERPHAQAHAASTSHDVSGVHSFEMCPWPSVSGASFINTSFHHPPTGHGYGEQEQHEFQPKMKATQRKETVRFYSISNRNVLENERKLRMAASLNDLELLQKLLNDGINPKCCDSRQRAPLHLAACKGHSQIAAALIDWGADPNQQDIIGNTPLHLAACTNHTAIVTLLLKAGSAINSIDNSGRTPLHLAQSKLRLLKQTKASEIDGGRLKEEVLQVVEMMQIYLQRSGKVAELDVLSTFTNRLHLHQSKEEMDVDVEDLLSSLDHLSLQKS